VAVPKPYSILAAAFVASGRSLSTVTLAAPVNRRSSWQDEESEDLFDDPGRADAYDFESPFAVDRLAERIPANDAALFA
jgi:hypothetical protein